MKFSVVLEAVTKAFDTAINQAKTNYSKTTRKIREDSEELSRVTEKTKVDLADVFKAPDASGVALAVKKVTAELNAATKGATLTSEQLKQVGTVGKLALNELNGTLRVTQAELKVLAATKASPQDIQAARDKVRALKDEVTAAKFEFGAFQVAASRAMLRAGNDTQVAAEKAKAAASEIYKTLNLKSGGTLKNEIAQITKELTNFKAAAGAPAQEVTRVTQAAQARISALKNEIRGIQAPSDASTASIRSMGAQLLALGGASAGLAGVVSGLKAIVDTTIQFQAVNKQLEFATGNSEAAAVEFQFISKVANDLGLDLLSAAQGYAKLAAATKGTQLEGQATRDIFLGVSQAAATMGLSVDEQNGVFLALSQIAGKGKVSMEELRGQLGERLPPAMKIAADSMGVTVQRLGELVENGLDAEEFLGAFGPALQKAFAADAAKNVNTLQGSINLMRNELKLALKDLGEGGVGDAAATIFRDLTGAISQVREALRSVDPTTVQAVKSAFESLYSIISNVFSTLFSAVGDASSVLDSLASLVTGVVNAFLGLDTASDDVSFIARTLQGLGVVLGAVSDGVYAIRLAFTVVTGATQEWFSNIALGLSKVTFGGVSKELLDLSNKLGAASQQSYLKAEQLALNFETQFGAALDRTVVASQDAATKQSANLIAGADKSAQAQGQVGVAAEAAAGKVVSSSQAATTGIEDIGKASETAKQRIEVFAGAGGTAIFNVANSVNEVRKAFTELAKDAGVQLPAAASSSSQLGLAMGTVAAKSKEAADSIAREIPGAIAKLNSVQLAEFRDSFIGGLEKAGASAEYVKARVLDFTSASAKALGVDLASALTTTSKQFDDSRTAVIGLAGGYDKLKSSGVDAGRLLSDSLTAMLNKAKNPVEVDALVKLWQKLGSEGKITGQALVDGLEKARAKADEMRPGINSLAEAFKTLGVKGGDEAKKMSADFEKAYFKIETSGRATTQQLQQAFTAYANNAIEANGGVASEWIQAKAAALGLEVAVDSTGKTIVQAMNAGASATSGLTSGINQATEAVKEYVGWADRVKERNDNLGKKGYNGETLGEGVSPVGSGGQFKNKDGFASDAKGNAIAMGGELTTRVGIINFLRAAGVDDMNAAKSIANQFADSKGDIPYFNNPGQKKYNADTLSMAVLKAAETYLYGGAGAAAGGSIGRVEPGSALSASSSTAKSDGSSNGRTVVEFKGVGGASTTMSTNDPNGAEAVVKMLKNAGGSATITGR